MTRAWFIRQIDAMHCAEHDAALAKCFGMLALGALILLTAAHNTSR